MFIMYIWFGDCLKNWHCITEHVKLHVICNASKCRRLFLYWFYTVFYIIISLLHVMRKFTYDQYTARRPGTVIYKT